MLTVLFGPIQLHKQSVLGVATNVSPAGLLESTNIQRTENHSNELKINNQLNKAAQNKATDMVSKNYWSHKTPNGNEPWVFISGTNYAYRKAGENLAYGFDSSSDVVTGWMNSPSHRKNLLDNDFSEVGFGIASSENFNRSGPATVVVAMYAQPLTANAPGAANGSRSNTYTLGEGRTISTAGIYTGTSWSIYAIGAIIGLAVLYLSGIHGYNIKRAFKRSERFFIKHPLLDSAVIALIGFGIILLRTAGNIL